MPKRRTGKGHMTLKIPRSMAIAIEKFLDSDKAKRLGFDSKSDVVTHGVRLFFKEYLVEKIGHGRNDEGRA